MFSYESHWFLVYEFSYTNHVYNMIARVSGDKKTKKGKDEV